MNARDEVRGGWEPTEEETALERELREMQPWRPSLHLRRRIEEEAARCELGEGEPEAGVWVQRFPAMPAVHALAAVAAAAALVVILLTPFWLPGSREEPGALATGLRSGEDDAGESSVSLIRRNREADAEEAWRREEYLLGSEPVGMVEPEEGPAMWRVRYRVLNRTAWQDEETGAMREHFVPEDRVLFVPVRHY